MRRSLSALIAAGLAAVGLGACSAHSPTGVHTVALARNLTVTLPVGAKASAEPEPAAARSLGAYHSLLTVLAPAVRVSVSRAAVVSFHVKAQAGTRPFLASFTNGAWVVVPSTYKAGILSSRVPGDPVLAPLDWAGAVLKAMVSEALQSVFQLAATGHDPACAPNAALPVDDSNPQHHTIGYCAEPAQALPLGHVITQFTNERTYPVDLSYPASVNGQCGEYGKCLNSPATNDVWVRLGSLLSPGNHHVLLPGDAQASAIAAIPAGQSATFTTSFDAPAAFFGFLESGLKVFAAIMTRGTTLTSADIFDKTLKVLDGAACLRDGWQGSQLPLRIATSAFSCVGAYLPDVLKLLGFSAPSLAVDAFQTATGFVAASFGDTSGTLDEVTGASNHVLTVHGTPGQNSPASFPIQYPGDMTLACIQQYGQGSQARWVDTVSTPSYGVQCFQGSSLLGGLDLDKWCPADAALHHYSSPAGWYSDNPYRYSAATSTIKPWTTWRCYQS